MAQAGSGAFEAANNFKKLSAKWRQDDLFFSSDYVALESVSTTVLVGEGCVSNVSLPSPCIRGLCHRRRKIEGLLPNSGLDVEKCRRAPGL
jgi:hypothetical protein